jgi:hypothetical protein
MIALILTLIILGVLNSFVIIESKHYIAQPIVQLFYYIIMEGLLGRTIGKFVTRTKVEFIDKTQNKFVAVLIRTVSRIIPFEPLSIFFDEKNIMWHDKFSKSKVEIINKHK